MQTITLADRTWHFSHTVGCDNINRGFRYPCDIAFDSNNHVWVLSRGMPIWPDDSLTVTYRPKIGKWSIEDGDQIGDFGRNEFIWPTSLASDSNGDLYCCDEYGNFVAVFGPDGPYYKLPEYDPSGESTQKWGEHGNLPGQLNGPAGIEFDQNDNLYLVDSGNNRIQIFTKDGRFIDTWGDFGTDPGQFNNPWGITIDSESNILVADWGNHRIQKFTPDGNFVMSIESTPQDDDPLYYPSDVAVDRAGDIYVADWGNNRVKIFEPNGNVIGALYGDATELYEPIKTAVENSPTSSKAYARISDLSPLGRFNRPVAVKVDKSDRLFVVDSRRGRIQIYSKDQDYEAAPITT